MIMQFTIPLEPRTKKNSGRIARKKILPSAAYIKYAKDAIWFIPRPDKPIDFPVNIKALYYMASARRVDRTNLESALLDILVDAGVLKDDNYRIAAGSDGSRVRIDRANPRTEVEITELEDV